MQQQIGSWTSEYGWQDSLDEIRQFLDTWHFHISESGHLYVRPNQAAITCRDVSAFLRRLEVLGDDRLPEIMTFDFRSAQMCSNRWRRIQRTLRRYSELMGPATFLSCEVHPNGGVVMIMRSAEGSDRRRG